MSYPLLYGKFKFDTAVSQLIAINSCCKRVVAIREKLEFARIWKVLNDPEYFVFAYHHA